ncbi:transglutaminase-like domain-containing protein [Streptomyces apocyni]|uniref:transglutaminase-like domain-containing protein n=1 Tax=Streptomyces apocyni TaxID=2654677 RepID=UPI0012EA0769|nr:transglutaminase family protein [Streptomyces apocyni]
MTPSSCDTPAAHHLGATRILDWRDPRIQALLRRARQARQEGPATTGTDAARATLISAHQMIRASVRPVYALDDTRPASRTLARGRGSCSQRMAVLEAVARAAGVPSRVRGLLVDGAFWRPRFARLHRLVPERVVLAWPQFHLEGAWVDFSELYGPLTELTARRPQGFTNQGEETLFDAVAATAVDWTGQTCATDCAPAGCSAFDLSGAVRADLGYFPSRDALFAEHGQTLCHAARTLGEPVMSRRTAA